jgi:iron complex transport system ATP-binding protein
MSAPVRLSAQSLSVRLGGRTVLERVDAQFTAGALVALVGPNGAGKTTLLRALAGLIPADGRISFDERDLRALSARERARAIAYLPQGPVFDWPLAAEAVVALGRYPYGDAFGRLSDADHAAVADAMAATGTSEFAPRPITTLSGGERARVAVARAIATQARVVLADEPTASLDLRHQFAAMTVLRAAAQAGAIVIASLHDLALAARFADRVLVMDAGRIVADAPPRDALTPARLARVFGVAATMIEIHGVAVPVATPLP